MRSRLLVIVLSQFFCTSVWFAGNTVAPELAKEQGFSISFLAHLTSAIQFGFITGSFVFALLTISDHYSPSKVFFASAILAALFNLGITAEGIDSFGILTFRFFTGFFLAGIYPVGMKIASDYSREGLGRWLGFLVGALVLGTAFPHLLKTLSASLKWDYVIYGTTVLSLIGGLLILAFVPDGPYRKPAQRFNFSAFTRGFRSPGFRAAAFGYFGHMWELYTFWAFVPLIISGYNSESGHELNVPFLSFLVIGIGSLSCICSGIASTRFGTKNIATLALILSCACCILSPVFLYAHPLLFTGFLFFWAIVVIADSPLFSTLVAQNAPEESRGTSLTIVNCIGFSITIASIQFLNFLSGKVNNRFLYMVLAIGPALGILALLRNYKTNKKM
jgi:MFS family permease